MALMKVKRTARISRGRRMTARLRLVIMAAAIPYKLTTHERAATNMVKLIAAMAEDEALILLAMTLPIRAVMSSVQRRPAPRTTMFKKPDIVTGCVLFLWAVS